MEYVWYLIFNRTEFDATGLTSRTYTLNLADIGQKDVLVTKGESHGITYEGVFLSLEVIDLNPFEFDSHAIYVDADDDVYLGVPVAD